jgi:hypothetical protein
MIWIERVALLVAASLPAAPHVGVLAVMTRRTCRPQVQRLGPQCRRKLQWFAVMHDRQLTQANHRTTALAALVVRIMQRLQPGDLRPLACAIELVTGHGTDDTSGRAKCNAVAWIIRIGAEVKRDLAIATATILKQELDRSVDIDATQLGQDLFGVVVVGTTALSFEGRRKQGKEFGPALVIRSQDF